MAIVTAARAASTAGRERVRTGSSGVSGVRPATHERHNERTRLGHTAGESAQELYDAYAEVLREEAADAERLRWVRWWEPSDPSAAVPVTVCLGSRAVLMVFEKHAG